MAVPVSPCQSGEGKTYTEGEEKNPTDVRRKKLNISMSSHDHI